MKAAGDKSKPLKVKVGSVSVPVYPLADGRWCVAWHPSRGSKRQRLTRSSRQDAINEAQRICVSIANGQLAADELTAEERQQAVAAREVLAGSGLSIYAAAREAAAAFRRSRGQVSLSEMAQFWERHHPGAAGPPRTVDQAHAELVEDKRDADLDPRYRASLVNEVGQFVRAFAGRPVGELTAEQIRDYLRGLGVSWRTRNNRHAGIVTLFRFARSRGYLPQDRDTEPEKVPKLPRPRGEHSRPGVLTADELRRVLENVSIPWLPLVALSAFAGLRRAEVQRLDWSDVLWDQRLVHVREEVAKKTGRAVGDERYVPLRENLLAWLSPWRSMSAGPVCTRVEFEDELKRLRKLGVIAGKWKKNALRHSYGSYRAGEIKNLPQVADEMGNSVAIIRRDYRNPRTERDVAAWASLFPADAQAPANVVRLEA